MKLLMRYLRPCARSMSFGLSIKVLATLLELMLPFILSHILDVIVPRQSVLQILLWGGAMLLCAIGAYFGNVIANRNAARVARDASRHIRHDLFAATMHLSAKKTDRFTIPSLESRLTSDTYNVHHFIGMMQRMGVRAPMLLFGGIAITLFLDWRLALILLAILPLIGVAVFAIARRGLPLYQKSQQAVDGMVRVVREDCQGVRVVKALSREEYEKARFDAANTALIDAEHRAGVVMASSQPVMSLLLHVGLSLVIGLGAIFVQGGVSAPGRIIAFMQYFTLMSTAMSVITRIFAQYSKCMASAARIEEVIGAAEQDKMPKNPDTGVENAPHIQFEDVSFSYNGRRDNLKNISFSLPRGGTLGIIGATGAGKTTLVQLLMRFYDADRGRILIDGCDVRELDEKALRARFGVVMQNDFIYADTVAENIRFGRDISNEQMRRAARLAQAEEFIEAFPEKYEHLLTTKGTNVSGGQRQRL
ncbi:MAG: ABC transporter ATP-binding protein, partial [Clostridia bacterium]|nr:ABC transporter ATP-binding protein [Clostridia bacterium]